MIIYRGNNEYKEKIAEALKNRRGVKMGLESSLKTYREKTARIEVLELEIEGLKEEIKYSKGIQESDAETIEGMTFRRSLDGMSGGEVESKTERIALNFEKEQDRLSQPEDIFLLNEEIRKKQSEVKRLQSETLPIEKALKGLSDKQKLIIDEFYIKDNTWYAVSTRYKQVYGYPIARDTCRKIRDSALKKLERILA